MIKNIKLDTNDILVSFDVVSLFMKIPINEAWRLSIRLQTKKLAKLVEICLKSTFFSFQGEIYEQTCGVAMGNQSCGLDLLVIPLSSSPMGVKTWRNLLNTSTTNLTPWRLRLMVAFPF
jgi:hypothetical protein